ncbi:MAG TPA: DUF3108 domain-containing protein [Thermoanaerobaculia bacterium]|nr:DUF3108 domain-containing protein [Thermoanaerobaculia bacterium]
MKIIRKMVIALTLVVSASAFAANPGSVEEFRYSWRLRGGVRLLAGLMFPTSGVGNLRTTFGDTIHSELLITAPNGKQGGFYAYESQMDERAKTLMTYHGYAWGQKSRNERTVFDYVKGLARIRKQTPEEVENRVKKLPEESDQHRDILTAIYFLRQNAKTMNAPMQTTIYSDGKEYPVIFRPGAAKSFVIEGKQTTARAFHIVDAPGGKKWSGGVTVWLTNDDRRVPVRIEIQQSLASLQLDLQKIESGALLAGM